MIGTTNLGPLTVVALLPCVLLTSMLATPRGHSASAEDANVRLSTVPRRVTEPGALDDGRHVAYGDATRVESPARLNR